MASVVEVHDLHKRYRPHDPWAVHGVTFAIEPGRAFGLLGPNGAGKSTVVKTIVGLTYLAGKVLVLYAMVQNNVIFLAVRRKQV